METFMMKALQLIVALVILVIIHEFGHYIFARIFGIKVDRFYLFFNPWFSLLKYAPSEGTLQLIGWTTKAPDGESEVKHALLTIPVKKFAAEKNGKPTWAATLYGIGWLPLGGYCSIAGMVDETTDSDKLSAEPQPWEFRTKGVFARFCVMVAGVLFNFLLAICIYAGIAMHWGDRTIPYQSATEGMDFAQPLVEAGLRPGDILLEINGKKADAKVTDQAWDMMQPGARVTVLRNHADTITITMPAQTLEQMAQANIPPMRLRLPVVVDQVQGGTPAKAAGMQDGDRILRIASDTTPSRTEFFPALAANAGKEVPMLVLRDGKEITLDITPDANGKIGIMMAGADKIYPYEEVKYNFFRAIPRGVELGVTQLTTYVESLKLLFTKSGAQQVGGFGTLGSLFPESWNWYAFWQITAFLSVILAFMNIIPIPGLDGGYILFLLWEMITRRRPSDKFLEVANTVGFCFLLLLLIWANGNDLLRALR